MWIKVGVEMVIADIEVMGRGVCAYLEDTYEIGYKPSYIGSHTVCEDSTAGKSVDILR